MGRVYRRVEIETNDKKDQAIAIIDTGADETVISEKLANKLNADLHGEFLAKCASQTILRGRYAWINMKELKTGKQAKIEAGVSDIPFDTDDIDEEGIDVIIGVDFVQKASLFDF